MSERSNAPGAWRRLVLWRPRLRPPEINPTEGLRVERVIAIARLLLTTITLVQVNLDALEIGPYARTIRGLLILFTAHAVSALLVLRASQRTSRSFVLTTSVIDLAAAALTLPIAAPTNSFFAFFLFVLAAAAFRWGFRETLALTAVSMGLVFLHGYAANRLGLVGNPGDEFAFDNVAGRAAYIAMMGLLLGYLAEEAGLLRAEAAAVAGLLARIRVDAGLMRAAIPVAEEVVELFHASHLMVVLEERATQRLFCWDTVTGWSVRPAATESPADRQMFFFSPATLGLGVVKRSTFGFRSPYQIVAIDSAGREVDATGVTVGQAFAEKHPFKRLLDVPMSFGDEWSGRLFIFDPQRGVRPAALVQFLQTIVQQVGPALFGVYLQSQLQARAGAMERARVARELHDGVIQSLVGLEMQLQVLRNNEPVRSTAVASELTRLQYQLRTEVLNLRDLMQQLRPVEFDPDELLDYLADLVQRFGRETGISAQFLTDLKDVQLPWRVCFELVRIVQEGLVNVRKHSAAARVTVRFGLSGGNWTLEITDDGRGFPFVGRFSQDDLDNAWRGPTIIKERVKAIGGQLAIDSSPGKGTRLEVLVPQETNG